MSLLDNIPDELSLLIKHYNHSIICHKCKRKTLIVRMCSCSPKTKLCEDCILKCNSCNYYISENNKFLFDIKTMTVAQNSSSIKIKIDPCFFIFPMNYYSLHSKCEYCEGLFCYYCSTKSVKICSLCILNNKYYN